MSRPISRRVVAEEVRFDDGGVGIQIGDMVYMGLDLQDLARLVERRNEFDLDPEPDIQEPSPEVRRTLAHLTETMDVQDVIVDDDGTLF